MSIDHLFVIWGAPSTGCRHVVGHLARTQGVTQPFSFWYEADLDEPRAQGFRLLPVFPEPKQARDPYRARHLFTTFAERIPSPARSDTSEILKSWGVRRTDDPFEVLARSGGLRATDSLELAEFRASNDTLESPLEVRVAGRRHIPERDLASLRGGEMLEAIRDVGNSSDPFATLLVTSRGERAGYVPRQYSEMIAHLLERGIAINGEALRELTVPEDAGRWVVRLQRR